jgi:hypothetical protein
MKAFLIDITKCLVVIVVRLYVRTSIVVMTGHHMPSPSRIQGSFGGNSMNMFEARSIK